MKIWLGFILLVYWIFWILFLTTSGTPFLSQGYTTTAENKINNTAINPSETDTGGLFGTGVSFGRFIAFGTFGVGIPESANVPDFFALIIAVWQTMVTFITVMWIISAIWNG